MIEITMENGKTIRIELDAEAAPITVENFTKLVKQGFYDGLTFHRIIPGFMIQGGCPEGTGMGGPGYGIKGEFAANGVENPIRHTRGVISMARSQMPNSAGSQFFIMHADAPHLDGSYAAFGHVVEGMDVVDEIASVATDFRDKPKREEMVDSFLQMADLKTPKAEKDVVAYAVKGTRLTPYSSCVIFGTMSAQSVRQLAREKNCTVTELITACIIWATEQDRLFYGYSKKLPVAVSVPCNLKRYFPSPTLRNFIAVMPIINDNSTDFDSVLEKVREQFAKKNNKEFFMGVINFNVKSQLNPMIKIAPLVIKDMVLKFAIRRFGDRVRTSTFSNLGVAKAPREFEDFVERYEFSLGPQVRETTGWSAVTYKDNFVLCAARTIVESNIERLVFSKLAELGVNVTLETNCEV